MVNVLVRRVSGGGDCLVAGLMGQFPKLKDDEVARTINQLS